MEAIAGQERSALGESSDYYSRIAEANLRALWTVPEPDFEPKVPEAAHVWKWEQLEPLLLEAAHEMELGGEADRRALNACNPGTGRPGATHSLMAGYQLVMPGEVALAHRHSMAAIRFILAGRGNTVVNGEPVLMEPGDLVLTPAMDWHDHRNHESEPLIWLDGLDAPFVRAMRSAFYEDYPSTELQPLRCDEGDSNRRYQAPGLRPVTFELQGASPLLNYKWADTMAALTALSSTVDQAVDDIELEYINPVTGGPCLPTMECSIRLLPAGSSAAQIRHTASAVFCVAKGSGRTSVDGTTLEWAEKDFFAIPSWSNYRHEADPDQDAVLFKMSDRPLLMPFGLYREERTP